MIPYTDSRVVRFVLGLFFILLIAYAIYEARGLLTGPVIHVPEETLTVNEPYVLVRGYAQRITELRMNGKTISVTEGGAFEEPYLLAQGFNRLILEATDARGRGTQKILSIIYNPLSPSLPSSTSTKDEL